jgi:hypothetical protein
MSASPKLVNGLAGRGAGVVAGDLPGGAVSVPAEQAGRPRACQGSEVVECAWLIGKLRLLGVVVRVEGDRVIFSGEAGGLFAETGVATLRGRERAVRRALEFGPAYAEKIVQVREASSSAIRRGRKPRPNHAKKNLSSLAAAVGSSIRRKSSGTTPPACTPPSVMTFLDRETR